MQVSIFLETKVEFSEYNTVNSRSKIYFDLQGLDFYRYYESVYGGSASGGKNFFSLNSKSHNASSEEWKIDIETLQSSGPRKTIWSESIGKDNFYFSSSLDYGYQDPRNQNNTLEVYDKATKELRKYDVYDDDVFLSGITETRDSILLTYRGREYLTRTHLIEKRSLDYQLLWQKEVKIDGFDTVWTSFADGDTTDISYGIATVYDNNDKSASERLAKLNGDGEVIWSTSFNQFGTRNPWANYAKIKVDANQGKIYAISPKSLNTIYSFDFDGTLNWEYSADSTINDLDVDLDGGIYYVSGSNAESMFANLMLNGEEEWSINSPDQQPYTSLEMVGDGTAYLFRSSTLVLESAKSGIDLFQSNYAPIGISNDLLIIDGEDFLPNPSYPVGTFNVNDPDHQDFHTINLANYTDNFEFIESENNPKDFELMMWSKPSDSEINLEVEIYDAVGNLIQDVITIQFINFNANPTDLSISIDSFNENVAGGSAVASLSSTDPDDGETFTYSLVDGVEGTDNSAFTIDGDQLKIKLSPDYETQSSYSVRLQTEDSGGLTFIKAFTFNVDDIKPETTRSPTNFTLPDNVENLVLTGTGNLKGYGNSGNNRLTGNAGNNVLDGKGGVDVMSGKGGDDTYIVDEFKDRVIEKADGGTDTIKSSVTETLSANVENLVLTGSENLKGYGNGGSNRLTGNSGNNLLDGKGGIDVMSGKGGNDTYIVDESKDRVIEKADGGTDTIRSSVNETLSAHVENLVLTGTGNLKGYGNSGNN